MRMAEPLDPVDRRIINALQGGFPLVDEPFRMVAQELGLDQASLIARIEHMLEKKILTRFGPMFQVERMGGAFVLAALAVPEADFERVAEQVNALPEVAHNYRRTHRLNMWFVLATETSAEIDAAIDHIERETGLSVLAFPKEREYYVDMRLVA
jgi:DNA-binding Lrp family transcriptional regulator